MKKSLLILVSMCLLAGAAKAVTPFRFAQLTDVHLSVSNPNPMEDLHRSIDDINNRGDIAFVVISGDITEAGDRATLEKAKSAFDRLNKPYYVTSGNHETTWSESGVMDFSRVFGDNRFSFVYNDVIFLGFNSGPVLKMADGHVAPQDIDWAQAELEKADGMPAIIVTHYPLKEGDVDNWYEVTDMLRQYNVQAIFGGHYHRSLVYDCDGLPDILHRSNLRGKEATNGYGVVEIGEDSIRVFEKINGQDADIQWYSMPMADIEYGASNPKLRPSFEVNEQYPNVENVWQQDLRVGVYASPVLAEKRVYIGDDEGHFYCMCAKTGKILWQFKAASRIFSTAAVADGKVVFGSTDGNIYCLNAKNGKLSWKKTTEKAVMGCVTIANGVAYIGGSDGCFRALNLKNGADVWTFDGLKGYCVSRPLIYNDKIYFGAWDCNFYALKIEDGSLAWKWNNGKTNDKFSPAAVWPVATDGKIFIAAPDRYMTALDAETGEEVWRTNRYKVRETVALSEDEKTIYSKCMWDTVVAFAADTRDVEVRWAANAEFGYEHAPSMPFEKNGTIWVATKNGLLLGLNAKTGEVMWKHKLGNCILNTTCPISDKECLVSSSDGKVTLVRVHD